MSNFRNIRSHRKQIFVQTTIMYLRDDGWASWELKGFSSNKIIATNRFESEPGKINKRRSPLISNETFNTHP